MPPRSRRSDSEPSGTPLLAALTAAGDKPDPRADREAKRNYAQRLSGQLAIVLANALRAEFPAITPTADGQGQEAQVGTGQGAQKRLDVKVADPLLGLLLCVSVKTYSFQDYDRVRDRLGRWTKNIVRNDHELRGEALVLHRRQPYSLLTAVLFEPLAACDDGDPARTNDRYKSSFAHQVEVLSKRAGRGRRPVYAMTGEQNGYLDIGADDSRHDLFERVFIGLYETEGDQRGAVRFFDTEQAPPRNGPPSLASTLTLDELAAEIARESHRRNHSAPSWAAADDDSD